MTELEVLKRIAALLEVLITVQIESTSGAVVVEDLKDRISDAIEDIESGVIEI